MPLELGIREFWCQFVVLSNGAAQPVRGHFVDTPGLPSFGLSDVAMQATVSQQTAARPV